MQKSLYTRMSGPHIKLAIYTAAVFNAQMATCICVAAGPTYVNLAIYTATVFNTKLAIYTAAGPTNKNSYQHGCRFQ